MDTCIIWNGGVQGSLTIQTPNKSFDFVKMTSDDILGRVKSILPNSAEASSSHGQDMVYASLDRIARSLTKSKRLKGKRIMDYSVLWSVPYFRDFFELFFRDWRDYDGKSDKVYLQALEMISKTIQFNNNQPISQVEQFIQRDRK